MALTETWSDIVSGLGINGFVGGARARSAEVNTYILQNLLWLKKHPYGTAQDFDGTVFSTSSSTFQDTGVSATLTTTGGRVMVVAFGTVVQGAAVTSAHLTLYEDGVNKGDANEGMLRTQNPANALYSSFSFVYLTPTAPTAASHTWKLYLRSADNTNACFLRQYQIWAIEIGA